jgi:hypothetical protein
LRRRGQSPRQRVASALRELGSDFRDTKGTHETTT